MKILKNPKQKIKKPQMNKLKTKNEQLKNPKQKILNEKS